jgi:hypothetical protein
MRETPPWFQDELTRIGGVNQYGEPIFRLVWSPTEKMVVGGKWEHSGFEGYRVVPAIFGVPCWSLMVWEPREFNGTPEMWEIQTRDPATGYLQFGGYPKYGYYRLMKRFMHREVEHKETTEPVWIKGVLRFQRVMVPQFVTYRLEPTGLILDLMLPMLIRWRKLSEEKKRMIMEEREEEKNLAYMKKAKDIRDGNKVRAGSPMVAKRAELIEKGFMQAMKIAAKTGLGMRVGTC